MRTFKLSVFLKDEDYDFDYRYGKTVTYAHLVDDDNWEVLRDNLIGYLDAVRDELKETLEGEEFGDDDNTEED